LLFPTLIGAVASALSMTPMASIAAARLLGHPTPGRLILLDRPLFTFGALAMGAGELFGDKMKTAPDRTVSLGLAARVTSAGIAGAALANFDNAMWTTCVSFTSDSLASALTVSRVTLNCVFLERHYDDYKNYAGLLDALFLITRVIKSSLTSYL
jgi:uncharacterized membrane protein